MNRLLSICFVIYLLFTMPFVTALSLSDIQAIPSATQATISWQTDENANAFVEYSDGNETFVASDETFQQNHSVVLDDLEANTRYSYKVISVASESLDEQESGELSFTTTPENSGDLFFNADLPVYSNGQEFSIEGSTLADALVIVYVNDVPIATAYANEDGVVQITGVRINSVITSSIVRVNVEHPTEDFSIDEFYEIMLDRTAPNVDLVELESVSSTGSLAVQGQVNEQVDLQIVIQDREGETEEIDEESVEGNFTIPIFLDEGSNVVKIFAEDVAGNSVSLTRKVFVDSQPPRILEHNLDEITPTYSPIVKITGRVDEPGVRVRIHINPEENGFEVCNDGEDNDGDGLVDYLHDPGCSSHDDRSEQDFSGNSACSDGLDNDEDGRTDFLDDPGCDQASDNDEADFSGESECNDGLDNDGDGQTDFLHDMGCEDARDESEDTDENDDYYETTADDEGYFEKEITLTTFVGRTNLRLSEAVRVATQDDIVSVDRDDFESGNQIGVEYDSSGINADQTLIRIEVIDQVGQRDQIEGLVQYATCGVGGEWNIIQGEIYPTILQPDLIFEGAAQISFTLGFEYFGVGTGARITGIDFAHRELSISDAEEYAPEKIFNPDNCQIFPPSNIIDSAYVVCNLARYPPERQRNITEAYEILEELESMVFPLKLYVDYEYTNEGIFGEPNNQVNKRQEVCYDVEVFIDRRLPPDAIPEGLLNVSVETLDTVIDGIDQVIEPLETTNLVVTGVCLASNLWLYVQSATMQASCLKNINDMAPMEQLLRGTPEKEREQAVEGYCGDDNDGCVSCGKAIKANLGTRKTYTQICDRIYCPATPTVQAYIEQNFDNPASACQGLSTGVGALEKENGCGLEYINEWGASCVGYSTISGRGNILEASQCLSDGSCESGQGGNIVTRTVGNIVSGNICVEDRQQSDKSFYYGDHAYLFDETTDCHKLANDGYSPLIQSDKKGEYVLTGDDTRFSTLDTSGYQNALSTSGLTDCVRTDARGNLYFVPVDKNTQQAAVFDRSQPSQRLDLGREGSGEFVNVQKKTISIPDKDGNYASAEVFVGAEGYYKQVNGAAVPLGQDFSYAQVQTVEVGKNTYYVHGSTDKEIEDNLDAAGVPNKNIDKARRDLDQVRGPDQLSGQDVPDILIDATASFGKALTCGCLPAISGYLQQIRNILAAIRNCFDGVLTTKEFQSGMCKAVLTQYLCDWVFELIGCLIKAGGASDSELQDPDNRVNGLTATLTALNKAGQQTKETAYGRYGNTATFDALFTQRKLLHAVCLAAFGYDWLPDLDAAINVGGEGFGINSTAIIAPATRRFMSANPQQQGVATFVYHVGYFLTAGDDINYRLELVCSPDDSCLHEEGFDGGKCDCSYGATGSNPNDISGAVTSPEQYPYGQGDYRAGLERIRVIDSGSLQAGESTEGQGEIYQTVTDRVRYDKIRLTWTPIGNPNGKPGSIIRDVRRVGANPPVACNFNQLLQAFECGFEVSGLGEVPFKSDPEIVQRTPVAYGSEIFFDLDVAVLYPEQLTYHEQNPKWVSVDLIDHLGVPVTNIKSDKYELDKPMPIQWPKGDDGKLVVGYAASQTDVTVTQGDGVRDRHVRVLEEIKNDMYLAAELKDGKCVYGISVQTSGGVNPFGTNELTQTCTLEGDKVSIPNPKITIDNFPESGRVVMFVSETEGPTLACDGDVVEWKAIIKLHDSIVDSSDGYNSRSRARINPTPAASFELPFRVACNGDSQTEGESGDRCDIGEYSQSTCMCDGTVECDQSYAGAGSTLTYCGDGPSCQTVAADEFCPDGVSMNSPCICGEESAFPSATGIVCQANEICNIDAKTCTPDNPATVNI